MALFGSQLRAQAIPDLLHSVIRHANNVELVDDDSSVRTILQMRVERINIAAFWNDIVTAQCGKKGVIFGPKKISRNKSLVIEIRSLSGVPPLAATMVPSITAKTGLSLESVLSAGMLEKCAGAN